MAISIRNLEIIKNFLSLRETRVTEVKTLESVYHARMCLKILGYDVSTHSDADVTLVLQHIGEILRTLESEKRKIFEKILNSSIDGVINAQTPHTKRA